jgi:hypothetical protein
MTDQEIYNGFRLNQHDLYMAIITRDYSRRLCHHLTDSTDCPYSRCYDADGIMSEEEEEETESDGRGR